MTFMELVKLLSFTTPLLAPSWVGWKAGGSLGLFVGFLVGFLLGPGCFFGTRALDQWIDRHPQLSGADADSSWLWTGVSWLLCLGLFIWILGLSTLGFYLAARLTHYLSA